MILTSDLTLIIDILLLHLSNEPERLFFYEIKNLMLIVNHVDSVLSSLDHNDQIFFFTKFIAHVLLKVN